MAPHDKGRKTRKRLRLRERTSPPRRVALRSASRLQRENNTPVTSTTPTKPPSITTTPTFSPSSPAIYAAPEDNPTPPSRDPPSNQDRGATLPSTARTSSVRELLKSNNMTGNKSKKSSQLLDNQPKQRRVQSTASRTDGGASSAAPSIVAPVSSDRTNRTNRDGDRDRADPRRQAYEDLTGLLPGDIDAIRLIVNASEKRVNSQILRMYQKLAVKAKESDTVMSEISKNLRALETSVSNLKVLTLQNSTTIARGRSSSRAPVKSGKNTTKSAFHLEIEGKNPSIAVELSAVFHSDVICRAASQAVCSYMDSCHKAQEDYRMTGRTMAVLTYSLQRDMYRREFKSGLGKQHANFRFKIALCATRDVLQLTDDTFMEHEKQVVADRARKQNKAWRNSALISQAFLAVASSFDKGEHADCENVPGFY